MVCPGSVREIKALPPDTEQRSSPAAIDGTHSHTLLEHCLKNRITSARTLVGTQLSDQDGSFTVDDARAARVQVALDYVAENHNEATDLVMSERKVDPEPLAMRRDMKGTVDITIVTPNAVEVIDYKGGMDPVPVKDNPQLELYALGVLAGMPSVIEDRRDVLVRMTIIQPELALKGLPVISSWDTMSSRLINEVLPKLVDEAIATDDPEAPLVPGERQCKYCPAKPCRAMAEQTMGAVGLMFSPVVSTEVATADNAMDIMAARKDPGKMSGDELDQLLDAAPMLRQLIEAAEAEGQRRLEQGHPEAPKRRKLVNGRGSRSWTITDDEVIEKLVKMGVPKGSAVVSKVVSPAQVEKLAWEKRDGTKVSLSARQLRTIDSEYVAKVTGKPTMVPISDSRPAIPNVAQLFSAIPQAEAPAEPVVSLPSWLVP
jgi:hypothetical protein